MFNPEMGPRESEEETPQENNNEPEGFPESELEEVEEFSEMSPEDFQEMLAQLPIMEEDLKAKKEELEIVRATGDKDLDKIAGLLEVIGLLEDEISARKEIQGELE